MNVMLIGGGWIAETVYVPFLSELPEIENIYIQDVDFKLTKNKFSAFSKVQVIREDEKTTLEYHFVFILTPSCFHADELITALKENVVILVEKPICTTQLQAEQLEDALKNSNATVYVSAPFRYRDDMQELKRIISSGELGTIYHVEMSWMKRRGTPGSAWFTQKKFSGGGVLTDMGPHLLDLFYWLFGERIATKYLCATSSLFLDSGDAYADWHEKKLHSATPDVEDNCFSILAYDNLSLALNLCWASGIENDYAQIKVLGSNGALDVLTSIGFSTNTLYQETTMSLSQASKPMTKCMEIGDRKEPFRKLLHNLIKGEPVNLPCAQSALSVSQDIFNLYRVAQIVKGANHA